MILTDEADAAIYGLTVTNETGSLGFSGSGSIELPSLDDTLSDNADILSAGVDFNFIAYIPDQSNPIDIASYTEANLTFLQWDFSDSNPANWGFSLLTNTVVSSLNTMVSIGLSLVQPFGLPVDNACFPGEGPSVSVSAEACLRNSNGSVSKIYDGSLAIVPLPAAFPLMGTALAGMGLLWRRRPTGVQ